MLSFATGIVDHLLWLENENVYNEGASLMVKSHHQRAALFQLVLTSE